MTFPIEHPEVLKVILYCITRENKLFSTETFSVVRQVILDSFEDKGAPPRVPNAKNSLAAVLRSVNRSVRRVSLRRNTLTVCFHRMIETLNYVVGDLIPLLPPEFNVIKMFTVRDLSPILAAAQSWVCRTTPT